MPRYNQRGILDDDRIKIYLHKVTTFVGNL